LPQQIVLFSVIIYDFLVPFFFFFSLLISILPLRLATGKYIVKAGSENENTSGDEKDNPPVLHAGPLVDHMTGHHGSQQTHQIGHTIGDGDEEAGEAGGEIQVVDLEAGVDGSIQAHADDEDKAGEPQAVVDKAHGDQGHGGSILAQTVHQLADNGDGTVPPDEAVGQYAKQNGQDPHGQVGQRGYQTIGLDVHIQDSIHIGGQHGHQRFIAIVLTRMGHQNGIKGR